MKTAIYTLSGIGASQGTLDYFYDAAENFLYIFIADDAIRYFNSTIAAKRSRQQQYIEQSAKLTKYTYNDVRNIIIRGIQDKYGMNPAELLLKLTEGKDITSLVNIQPKNVSGIGQAIDPKTGYPVGTSQADINSKTVETIFSNQSGKPLSTVNNKTGQVLSTYNAQTQQFTAGGNDNNFWTNVAKALPFMETGKVLGKHKIFDSYKELQALRAKSAKDIFKRKRQIEACIAQTKYQINRGDKPHRLTERETKLRQYQNLLTEIERIVEGL